MMDARRSGGIDRPSTRRVLANDGFTQLTGAIIVSALLPFALFHDKSIDNTPVVQQFVLYGSVFALLAGHYFFRSLVFFPGARSSSYLLPIFTSTFAVVVIAFFFFRIDYSRLNFAISYVLCVVWYTACHFINARARLRRLAVIPVGTARKVDRIPRIDWHWLRDPTSSCENCDGIVVDLRADLSDAWERFIAEHAISGMPVYHVKQIEESVTGRVEIEHLSENGFGSLIPGLAYIKIKQWLDGVTALLAAILLLPALVLIALAVKIDSGGPAFFVQERVGFRGVLFPVFKFRTMIDGGSAGEARDHAITRHADDRITRLGRTLRHSRIDELPQILNILRGEMSWIGPRPEARALSEWYEHEIPFYRYRHIVRPGITGWAQVNQGHVAGVADVNDKLHFDFYYIKYFSPWLDVLIALRTIRTMVTGFGSR